DDSSNSSARLKSCPPKEKTVKAHSQECAVLLGTAWRGELAAALGSAPGGQPRMAVPPASSMRAGVEHHVHPVVRGVVSVSGKCAGTTVRIRPVRSAATVRWG